MKTENKDRQDAAASDTKRIIMWRSIEDELPSKFDYVLIYDGDLDVAEYFGNGEFWIRRSSSECSELLLDVTHWAYLPEPPKAT